MRQPYEGKGNLYKGTCSISNSVESLGCKNQIYVIIINRVRQDSTGFKERKVISVGWVFNGYGRSVDIPINKWEYRTEPFPLDSYGGWDERWEAENPRSYP